MPEAEAWQRQTPPTTTVIIKDMSGKTFAVPVYLSPPGDTLADLMELIQSREGMPPDQQRLIFEGKQLQDFCRRRLWQFGIKDGSVIELKINGC